RRHAEAQTAALLEEGAAQEQRLVGLVHETQQLLPQSAVAAHGLRREVSGAEQRQEIRQVHGHPRTGTVPLLTGLLLPWRRRRVVQRQVSSAVALPEDLPNELCAVL